MSSSKRFEKTFSRKNKDKDKGKEKEKEKEKDKNKGSDREEDQVLSTLAAKSRTSKKHTNGETSQTPKKPREKPTTSNKETPQKKQKTEKQDAQKQKMKLENGDIHKQASKKNVTPTKRKNKSQKDGKEGQHNSDSAFPTTRMVRIIKSEGSDYRLSSEAVFLINKATEKFIELFSKDAYDFSAQECKSFIAYKHLATAVSQEKRFDFLSDFIPEKLTAEKAMAERKPVETLPP